MSTKLGLHVTFGGRNGYGPVVAQAPAAVIAVGEGGALVEARQMSNGRTITIYREQTVYPDAPPHIDQMNETQARQAAEQYWPALKKVYALNPADYYQVTNETGGDNPKSLANIVAFETRLMELAEQDGFKLAIASPAGGSPGKWENWVKFFVPLIRRAGEGGHIYSRHAYGGVDPKGNGFLTKSEGGQVVPADENTGRPFREASYLRQAGIMTPMIITEAGQNGGYKFPGVSAFMEDAARYDALCQAHDNIWAFCLWTYGNYQNRPANIEAASTALAEYLRHTGGASRPVYPAVSRPASPAAEEGENTKMNTETSYILFDSPVGITEGQPMLTVYPEGWHDENPFKTRYVNPKTGKEAYHTGSDLNKAHDADRNAPVFAAADGVVTCARQFNVWGTVIVIKHADRLFSRYGHVQNLLVQEGDVVRRGQPIAHVGQDALGGPFHLHFDISTTAVLETNPSHWPGLNLAELETHYVDPAQYIKSHRSVDEASLQPLWSGQVSAPDGLNLRTVPHTTDGAASIIRVLGLGEKVAVLQEVGEWYYVLAGEELGYVFAKWIQPYEAHLAAASTSMTSAVSTPRRNNAHLEFGIHNEDGAEWMLRHGMRGWGLHTVALGTNSTHLDMIRFAQAGVKMLVRLNYGYEPMGNIPLPTDGENYKKFIHACAQTMQQSKGIWGFILGNETNNPNEWPGGPQGTPISAQVYVDLYNQVWQQKPADVRLAPQAVDPYYGPGSDNRVYWQTILAGLHGADFLTVHPKTQDSNPDNVDSDMKFGDDPLRWQYYHLQAYKPLLAAVPARFKHLPVIATEVNPQQKDNGTKGWEPGRGGEWVKRAIRHFQTYNGNGSQPITGVIFYRFSADEWAIHHHPEILAAIIGVTVPL